MRVSSIRALRPTRGPTGRRSRSLVSTFDRIADIRKPHRFLTEVVAFVCLVVFIFRLKANQGQSRMARLLRTILQDGILYFFVMAGFHIAMWILTALHRVRDCISSARRKAHSDVAASSLPLSLRFRSWCTYSTIPVESAANPDLLG